MHQWNIRRILISCVLATIFATCAFSQNSTEIVDLKDSEVVTHWDLAQQVGFSKDKFFVVTVDQPDRKHACRIKSFTPDKLVCKHAFGGTHIYLPEQIAALILPGDSGSKLPILIGLNASLGAAIWATAVLAAVCPACAVATGVGALLLFAAAGAIAIGDDVPDRLFYLAPGQQLSRKLGYVQH
ncbi:MAG TPA: hypothetical protein VG844_03870 [Terracidiphilus sp.]|nr:hypothetical protein [Terracidiphilus sp.]